MTVSLIERVRDDVVRFADRGTAVEYATTAEGVELSWTFRDRRLKANILDVDEATPAISFCGDLLTYQQFLAHRYMGNLEKVARQMLGDSPDRSRVFVDPPIRSTDENGRPQLLTGSQAILELTEPRGDSTRLLFLMGDPGVGKSYLLEEVARQAATDFLSGTAEHLFLIVSAKDRALVQMSDAITSVLANDLDVGYINYSRLVVLVRARLIRLVVDGFDEMVGGQGTYAEAFGSLASLIDQLDGSGSLVAAARSSYYEQKFIDEVDRLDSEKVAATLAFEPAEVIDWSFDDISIYLDRVVEAGVIPSQRAESLKHFYRDLPGEREVLKKPLFVNQMALSGDALPPLTGPDDPIESLVDSYIRREVESKIAVGERDKIGLGEFAGFLQELARTMWTQETTFLSQTEVDEVAEIWAEMLEFTEEGRGAFREIAVSRACLQAGPRPHTVAFEHELFQNVFLGREVSAVLFQDSGSELFGIPERRIPIDSGAVAARRLLKTMSRQDLVDGMVDMPLPLLRASIVSEVMCARQQSDESRLDVRDIYLGDVAMKRRSVVSCDMQRVTFDSTDLQGTVFVDCTAEDVSFTSVTLTEYTRLEIRGAECENFARLRYMHRDGRTVLEPGTSDQGRRLLAACGLPAAAAPEFVIEAPPVVTRALQSLRRHFDRSSILHGGVDSELDRLGRGVRDVVEALDDNGLVARVNVSSAGTSSLAFRPQEGLAAALALSANLDHLSSDLRGRVIDFWAAIDVNIVEVGR
ncbi:NACHT domain-containing NTPase [Cellulomonas sp. Y8]|uniref:NACHT domain-containing protein n=1 Tax=Cellulomonas sp. Y8 TaxID=2591145 RepID=UPI0011CBCB26|nr:NACHT domain-containing protein [Cellulomonas sp. Y8]